LKGECIMPMGQYFISVTIFSVNVLVT